MSGRVIPLRQQHNAVWVESLLLQRIDGTDHLTLDQINNGDRAVAHARQIEQRILHEGELLVLGDGDVMRTFRCGNRLDQLGLCSAVADVENVQMSRLRSRHIKTIRLAVEIDLQRHARLDGRKIESFRHIKRLVLRIPGRGPQATTVHIGDISDRRVRSRNKQDFEQGQVALARATQLINSIKVQRRQPPGDEVTNPLPK